MRPKPGVDPAELERLVRRQADAIQAMICCWPTHTLTPDSYDEQTKQRLERPYLESSEALKGLLEFPEYDDEAKLCCDHPDLAPCWRVYPITCNTVFPLQWRLTAHRTILPDELGPHIEVWTRWLSAVSGGEHRMYLFQLYTHEITKRLYAHWQDLKEQAEALGPETTAPSQRPRFEALRARILGRPTPVIAPAPIRPAATSGQTPADEDQPPDDREVMGWATELLSVIRVWAEVTGDESLCGYEADFPSFDQYLAEARDPWLLNFLRWAETCRSLGMGLFLDY
jgi:hypothetical protein